MKRVISLWLTHFATDRLSLSLSPGQRSNPLVTVTAVHGGQRIAAANPAAQAAGIAPGISLADARALFPALKIRQTTPDADIKALDKLSEASERYTPWTALDPLGGFLGGGFLGGNSGGLWLDITGCAHLYGGEDALLRDLLKRLETAGYSARAGLADTPGAAWALARFGSNSINIAPPKNHKDQLASLPMAGLRLDGATVEGLANMGLRRIGDLYAMPRGPLASRFGGQALRRLDQATGALEEPISPRRPPPVFTARRTFAEPISRAEDITAALETLLDGLCTDLEDNSQGVRQMTLTAYRVDNSFARIPIGASRPVRAPDHLMRLFRDKLTDIDPGFGIEVMVLAALETNPLTARQMGAQQIETGDGTIQKSTENAARLVDRLTGRLGPDHVTRLKPVASHLPERASRETPAINTTKSDNGWTAPQNQPERRQSRPIQLLSQPLPIEVMAPVPDGPPVMFRWRRRQHKVQRAEGPERIAPEWWRTEGRPLTREARDYYRLEDQDGQRFWIYREGLYRPDKPPGWYLHGFFA